MFDVAKLDWLNGQYLRLLSTEELLARTQRWGFDRERLVAIAELAQSRVERLSDLVPAAAFLLRGPARDHQGVVRGREARPRRDAQGARARDVAARRGAQRSTKPTVERVLKGVGETLGAKFRDLARVYYVAMTGSPTSLPLFDSMELLGRDIVRERFRVALDALGGVSAKEAKEWQRLTPPDD